MKVKVSMVDCQSI